jgi:hypothetical protein
MLADGSFVFASTEGMLIVALESLGLNPIYTEVISEKTLLTIENGSLVNVETLPELDPKYVQKFSYNYSGYRSMTSGGHSNSSTATAWDNNWYDEMPKVGQPTDYYGEDLEGYYAKESDPGVGNLNDPEYYGFPRVGEYYCNEYGEYFDEYGSFMGSVDDFAEMGYLSNSQLDDFTKAWWNIHASKM